MEMIIDCHAIVSNNAEIAFSPLSSFFQLNILQSPACYWTSDIYPDSLRCFIHVHICVFIKSVSGSAALSHHEISAGYFTSLNSVSIEPCHPHNDHHNNLEICSKKTGKGAANASWNQ